MTNKEEAVDAEVIPVEKKPAASVEAQQAASEEVPVEEIVATEQALQETTAPEDKGVETAGSKTPAGDNHIDLGDAPHISEIAELYSSCKQALDKGTRISIDATRVENIDGPSLQLLCSFAHEAHAKGVELNWGEIAEPLRNSVKLLGIEKNIWG